MEHSQLGRRSLAHLLLLNQPMHPLKQAVMDAIDSLQPELIGLSHDIHRTPELSLREHQASAHIAALLAKESRPLQMGVGGLDTAFISTTTGQTQRPHIAFLAEYDALPTMGHACGHNVIAAASVGAYLGICKVVGQLQGAVSLIGTPGEEADGGKIVMLEAGVFDNVDFALMIHPSSGKSLLARGGRAATSVKVHFTGKAAHSSAPSRGVNALSAVLSTFQNIDLLRPTFSLQDNVNGIITHGGTASNVIPGEAACEFSLRAATLAELKQLVEKMRLAIDTATRLTGAVAEVKVALLYAERYPNQIMSRLFQTNMACLGEEMEWASPVGMYGSSDIGNVSIRLPVIYDYLWIAPAEVNTHHADFTACAASKRADEIVIKAAKGLAMTAFDILDNASLQGEINECFKQALGIS
ncbi:MAG: p-aminobenzoyl-glutamate hydrolase subunit B [Firmicutes bacterium]|nr:p-aminobenzoyl-glutamate hydrolase subunit B [candidate division NPL-UPA2 bacterium]